MRQHSLLLLVMSAFLSLTFIDETGVAVALPDIQAEFAATSGKTHWALNAFFVSLAMFVAVFGKLSDRFGARRIFMWGTAVFALASVGCALAPSIDILIGMRFLKGLAASMMLATYAVLILRTVGPEVQGLALGICASYASFFLATGPFIGGFISDQVGWRALFAINLPICAAIALLGLKAIPADPANDRSIKISGLDALSTTLGIGAFVAALMLVAEHRHLNETAIALFGGALIAGIVMVFAARNRAQPIVDWGLFRLPTFAAANLVLFCTQSVVMCVALWAIYLQLALGMSPLLAGLALLPAGLPILVMGRIGGAWSDRAGPAKPMRLGTLLMFAGMVLGASVAQTQSYILLVGAMVLYGIGAPLTISPGIAAVMRAAPMQSQGAAAGIFNTARHLGAAVGIALFAMTLSLFDAKLSAPHLAGAGINAQTAQQALASLGASDPALRSIFAQSFAYASWILVAIAAIGLFAAWAGFRERSSAAAKPARAAI